MTCQTLEGLRDTGDVEELIEAFVEGHALQCGFCTPGLMVTLGRAARDRALAHRSEQLLGNLCRCTGIRPDQTSGRGSGMSQLDPRSIPRIGARRLARGEGRYVDDIEAPDALHAAFVRSPVAHAIVRRSSPGRGPSSRGVIAVYTAHELAVARGPAAADWMDRARTARWRDSAAGQRPGAVRRRGDRDDRREGSLPR